MSDFNSFHSSVGTSNLFWGPSLRMSDAVKVYDASAVWARDLKSGLALSESAWEKKRMVTVEIVVIAFKLTSWVGGGSKEKNMMASHPVIACCLTVLHNIVDWHSRLRFLDVCCHVCALGQRTTVLHSSQIYRGPWVRQNIHLYLPPNNKSLHFYKFYSIKTER